MSTTLSISKAGIEIYSTEAAPKTSTTSATEGTSLPLQTGEINGVIYLGELYSDNFESDYTDISSNSTVSVPIDYLKYFQKGNRIALKKGNQNNDKFKWEDMGTAITGFITDVSYNKEKVDVKISGMDKLLDQEAKFSFKKTKRSKIIQKIIEASGLKAKVNVSGLKDDVTDFTNISESSDKSSSSTATGGEGEDIDSKVQEIIGSETDDYKKMVLIHEWLRKNNNYDYYSCSHKDSASACLKSLRNNCADTARLTRAMMSSAGLDAQVVHYYAPVNGHFWTVITINGKEYASDATSHQRKINQVWKGYHYNKKCGKNPSC